MAFSRVLIVSSKMRFFKFADQTNELVTVNVHLRYMTAKKGVSDGANSLKKFWDELVAYIIRFRARVLAGDFNMALWEVIPELRARGVHVHLAAWYPWQGPHEQHRRIDSVAIFIIGPVAGIHKMFDASALEIWDDGGGEVPREWKLAEEVIHDPAGGQQRRPYAVQEFDCIGQGYTLSSYMPMTKDGVRREQCVRWTFAITADWHSPAVAEIAHALQYDCAMFPFSVQSEKGLDSWEWPIMPVAKQKPVQTEMFDPTNKMFTKGAHMPVMVWFGGPGASRRSPHARIQRAIKCPRRGSAGDGRGRGGGGSCGVSPVHVSRSGGSCGVSCGSACELAKRDSWDSRDTDGDLTWSRKPWASWWEK